ncbi:MAG: ATP-binding protein [Candidatus Nomurabacteria bacterium]|nr:MAG: ATP-binding protein [Candidatus Nomurabacteria bacterium]
MKVTILRGISGSGKTTWTKSNAQDATIISTDDFFIVDGVYTFDITKLEENHRKAFRLYLDSLVAGKEWIVVDNTNVQAWEYSPYVLAAGAYGYDVELLTFECSADLAWSRKQLLTEEKLRIIAEMFKRETEKMPRIFKNINRTIICS